MVKHKNIENENIKDWTKSKIWNHYLFNSDEEDEENWIKEDAYCYITSANLSNIVFTCFITLK